MKSFAPIVLLALSLTATAEDGLNRAKQRGQLVAGVRYVVPEYKAGAKFRTPEAIDTALVEDVAKRLQVPAMTVPAQAHLKTDVVLAALSAGDPLLRAANVIATGHVAGPMAIMRTDTDIKRWEQLKGRTVCVSEGGLYAGTLAAKYGAIEMRFPAPADALLALRTGGCDAAVHDSAMLEEMLKLPEWKKFSATLPVRERTSLAFIVPERDAQTAAFLRKVAADWQAKGVLRELMTKAVRNIAFEVYLDQNVPDCH